MFKPRAERDATARATARALQKAAALLVDAKAIMRKKAEEIVSLPRFADYEAEEIVLEIVSPRAGLDAAAGRKARAGGSKGGRTSKDKRTRTADLVAEWRARLATRKGGPLTKQAEAKWVWRNCDPRRSDGGKLSLETIRRYLQRKP